MGAACSGITLGTDGRIYVSAMSPAKLKTFLPDGTPTPLALNGGGGSSGIALDSQGRLFVLIPGEYNADGLIRVFGPDMKQALPPFATHLNNVDGIAIDPSGKIFVASQGNQVIKAYDASGKPLDPTIKKGINTPRAIALGPDGKIYAANYTNVTSYYPDGERTPETITHINTQAGGPDVPMGIAVDPTGHLYIGYASGLLWLINPDGKPAGQGFMAQKSVQGIAVR
jgi:sugar lactone lactonase YvrE